jgi:parallel beta-helix repeat protein
MNAPVGSAYAPANLTRVLTAAGVLWAAPALAATYYVSPTGTGSACTQAQPCRQIRTALTHVGPSDTILVADGSYLGFDVDDVDGLPGQPITIRAQGAGANVTATTDRPDNRDTIFITFSDWIVIDGLRAFSANRAGLRVDQSDHVTVRTCVFGNNGTWGLFTDFSDDLLIENNDAFGSVAEHGIYVSNSGDRPTVRGNHLYNNSRAGLHMNGDLSAGGDGVISGALVENNVIHGNGLGGGAGINMDGVQDSTIRNNVLYDNHATGIVAFQIDGGEGPRGMQILHNTIDQAANGRWALQFSETTGSILVRNNILFNRHPTRGSLNYGSPADVANTDSDYNVLNKVSPDGDATIYTLPQWQAMGHEPHSVVPGSLASLFANADGGDYHLPVGSPAVDHGQTLASVAVDIDGTARPQGATSDAGAYERAAPVVPSVSIEDAFVTEGNAGTTSAVFTVRLSAAAGQTVTVNFVTSNGTASAPADYTATSGVVTFTSGAVTRTMTVPVEGDTSVEPDETFTVTLSNAAGATIADGVATGTIADDDAPPVAGSEIAHGASLVANLAGAPDTYPLAQAARASYEIIVDAPSGGASPVILERLAADQQTVLQSAVAVGAGFSRTLRWQNTIPNPVSNQAIRVRSGGCASACGAGDTYRIRAWDTTYAVARFNNGGTQLTILVVQNVTDRTVAGRAHFWNTAGSLLAQHDFTLAARATLVLNAASVSGAAGQSGTVTITQDGGYGALAGKAVALETATGFSFDSPMIPRIR